MTPQQANDYAFLPEHPAPAEPPSTVSTLAAIIASMTCLAVGAFVGVLMATGAATEAQLDQSFQAGVKIGQLCAHAPNEIACRPEAIKRAAQ